MKKRINMIVACDENYGIGYKGNLLVHIPEDMKRFKNFTKNNVVVMGRKTLESLPKGYLPNRKNIVLSKDPLSHKPKLQVLSNKPKIYKDENDVIWCTDVDTVLKSCEHEKSIWIIGGAEIYKQFAKYCNCLYLTLFKLNKDYEVDAYIDTPPEMGFHIIAESSKLYTTDEYQYRFFMYVKQI